MTELLIGFLLISIIFDAMLYHHFNNIFEAQYQLTDTILSNIKEHSHEEE
jgi:hypothetical protein